MFLETDTIELRGGPAGKPVRIGWTEGQFSSEGTVQLRPMDDEFLHGHVGLVALSMDGRVIGEISIVPDKISEAAYDVLRSDLQRVWSDLVLVPDSVASVRAGPPPATELWTRIAAPVRAILESPNEHLTVGTGVRRMERVRCRRDLQPAVVRAGLQQRSAVARIMERTTDTEENHLVAVTLQLLRNHARRDPTAASLVRVLDRLLRDPMLRRANGPVRRITWGMRSDPRYRQVLGVHQVLRRPELAATEGPRELRLGVPALTRLYEYWVYLQVLLVAVERYGPPLGAGFADLAVPLPGNRYRFEIPKGTTVTFPGPIHVAFEPEISTRGDRWMGLEYVPHPDPDRSQYLATPDVAVYRPGEKPWLTIIDAKYVGRHWVEIEAAKLHEKYARIRSKGAPVVRNVLAAHPHVGLAAQWAGYGHLPLVPGYPATGLPLPPAVEHLHEVPIQDQATAPDPAPVLPGAPLPRTRGEESVVVIADQGWMRDWLQGRRVDLAGLAESISSGRPVDRAILTLPDLPALRSFAVVAEHLGWQLHWLDSVQRPGQINAIAHLVREQRDVATVLLFSGDPDLIRELPSGPGLEVIQDLSDPPQF